MMADDGGQGGENDGDARAQAEEGTSHPAGFHRRVGSGMAGLVSEANGEVLKFGIVASDGREFPKHSHLRSLKLSQVWDHMSPDEASLLTAAHLAHPVHPDIPRSSLPLAFPHLASPEPRPYPTQTLPGTTPENAHAGRAFRDANAATHLTLISLADANRKLGRPMLSMTSPGTRGMGDDITAM